MSKPEGIIEVGDTVRVIATGQIVTTIGYMSAKDLFQVQIGNSPIPVTFVPREELELVTKANVDDGGPRFVPGSSIMG